MEVKFRSERQLNSIRPLRVASLQAIGEAQTARESPARKSETLRGSVQKRFRDTQRCVESERNDGGAT